MAISVAYVPAVSGETAVRSAPRFGAMATDAGTGLGSAPAAPGRLTVSSSTPTTATVSWPEVSGATGYRVERAAGNGGFVVVATLAGETIFNDAGLVTNTNYRYRVSAMNGAGIGDASPVGSVTPAVATNLAAPTGLAATQPTPGQVVVSWTALPSNTAVLVQRSLDGGITWRDLVNLPGTQRTYTDSVSRNTLYAYRLRASTFTAVSSFTGSVSLLTPPPEITSLLRTAISVNSAELTWLPSPGATGYIVEQSKENGEWTGVSRLAGGVVRTTVPGLESGTQYRYRVRATNAGGESLNTVVNGVLTIPAPPQNVTLEPAEGPGVRITFQPSKGAASYILERQSDGRPFARLATLRPDQTSYVDTQVTLGEAYDYRVVAVNESGSSAFSAVGSIGVTAEGDIPMPRSLAFSFPAGNVTTPTLSWAFDGEAQSFIVQRQIGATWRNIAIVPGSSLSTSLRGLVPGQITAVRVVAVVGGVEGDPSGDIDVQLPPGAVRSLKRMVLPNTPPSTVVLSWIPAPGSTQYRIERSEVGSSEWTTLGEGFAVASWVDESTSPGKSYAYRVTAGNGGGFGPVSASLFVLTAPPVPTGVTAAVVPSAKPAKLPTVSVSWTDVSGETGYRVQGSIDGVRWSNAATARPDVTSVTLRNSRFQLFRVSAANRAGTSAFSAGVPLNPAVKAVAVAMPTSAFSATLIRPVWSPTDSATDDLLRA